MRKDCLARKSPAFCRADAALAFGKEAVFFIIFNKICLVLKNFSTNVVIV